MIKLHQLLLIIFLGCFSNLNGQNIEEILIKNRWSTYDNFAVVDFLADGKAEMQYAYCTYCQGNKETLEWELSGKTLRLGEDTLQIVTANNEEVITNQNGQQFAFKNIKKLKKTKLKKEAIQQFLVSKTQLNFENKTATETTKQKVQFTANGKMWLDQPKFRGQWAVKSFFGDLFLIYIHRNTVNRNYPLVKINSYKKGKLTAQSIPSIKQGQPVQIEIRK